MVSEKLLSIIKSHMGFDDRIKILGFFGFEFGFGFFWVCLFIVIVALESLG